MTLLRSRWGAEWFVIKTHQHRDRSLASVDLIGRTDADAGRMHCKFSLPAPAFSLFCCANGINGRP